MMPPRTSHEQRSRLAFSLVELLAVVVIILLLLAIMMPLLKNAKLSGQRTVCLSNLGVLGKGFVQYPPNNDGRLMATEPYYSEGRDKDRYEPQTRWVFDGATEASVKAGALWPYVLDLRVYRCPSHPFQNFVRSYSWNDFINGGNYAGLPGRGAWIKIGQVPFPSRTLAQMDDIDPRGVGFLMGTWVIDVHTKYRYVDPVPSWHAGGMNVNFMDGHAEYWKWQDSRTLSMVTDASLNNMSAFFKSHAGSVDWWRLRQVVNPGYPDAPPPTTR
jgi:prepilin-type processing-associated H-X9-DG protein